MKGKVESSGLQVDGRCVKRADFQEKENREMVWFILILSQGSKCSAAGNRKRLSTRIAAGKSEYQSDSYKGQLPGSHKRNRMKRRMKTGTVCNMIWSSERGVSR